ncbi:uncharacterized protein PV09_02234 [Verruconis gallopava]|uniref:40S ribosomal protein S29 n=1 Tax=Verruconis gallopava TaxID=253628 RepID=A0A0D1XX83_9PEZI|nr:uncharacterized protein PV09_02234 [Verruconis gallopava]KIW07391.1 hypothetical protein PV09_02234 [Verruconis gallopava]
MVHKNIWNSRKGEVKYGKGQRKCRLTGEKGNGLIRKYGLNMSRQTFKEKAEEMGWKKYR